MQKILLGNAGLIARLVLLGLTPMLGSLAFLDVQMVGEVVTLTVDLADPSINAVGLGAAAASGGAYAVWRRAAKALQGAM